MEIWTSAQIIVVCIFSVIMVIFLFYFTYGVTQLKAVTDVYITLDDNKYILHWSDPKQGVTYIVDYILTLKGRNQPRQRSITKNLFIVIMRGDEPLTPADEPTAIRGIIVVRQPNMIDSPSRYFDPPFPKLIPITSV